MQPALDEFEKLIEKKKCKKKNSIFGEWDGHWASQHKQDFIQPVLIESILLLTPKQTDCSGGGGAGGAFCSVLF